MSSRIKVIYAAVISATVIILILAFCYRLSKPDEDIIVEIRSSGELVERIPLDEDETVYVPGPLGETVVVIGDNAVSVVDSPCPNHICINTGKISKKGETIICLPNRVTVALTGRDVQ